MTINTFTSLPSAVQFQFLSRILPQIYLAHVLHVEYYNTYPDSECDAVCTFFRTSNAFSIRASSVILSAFFIFTTITLNFGFSDS